jgi:hypothetical protein
VSRPELWAVVSDTHCGSTLGLCPPEGVQLDDGGRYLPSREQVALWEAWTDYWARVGEAREKRQPLICVINGDAVDGDHHGTAQIVSRNLAATQHAIAMATFRPMLALKPSAVIFIRGTEAHVGQSAGFEERLAEDLGAEETKTGTYSHWHFQAESGGVMLDFAHHGRVGNLPHTRINPLGTLAMRITNAAAKAGDRIPDLAIRSHMHQWSDTGDNFPVRVIQMAGWQLSTAFIHRVAAGSLPEIGGLIVRCEKGQADVTKVKYPWRRAEPWSLRKSA